MRIKPALIALFLQAALTGCSWLDMHAGYHNDPLTGGVNTQASALLNVPIPAGMQLYPSHGYAASTAEGREGLETLRGNVDANAAAVAMFNTLKSAGWQLRMSARKSQRAVYLYQKNQEYAVLSFHPQGMLTILEIWAGPRLPDGATLSSPQAAPDGELPSIMGEEYGPIEEYDSKPGNEPKKGQVETWGQTSGIQEREL